MSSLDAIFNKPNVKIFEQSILDNYTFYSNIADAVNYAIINTLELESRESVPKAITCKVSGKKYIFTLNQITNPLEKPENIDWNLIETCEAKINRKVKNALNDYLTEQIKQKVRVIDYIFQDNSAVLARFIKR